MFALRKGIPLSLVTASQWKNAFNKTLDLKALYEFYKLKSKKSPKEIHEFDATLINLYMFYSMNVDSEHSAIFQCLAGEWENKIEKI